MGPAGIPTVSNERTTIGGIKCAAELKLNAFEVEFVRRVGMSNEIAKETGRVAKKLSILLSVHCPYFVNLCSQEQEKLDASKQRILDSVERAFHMGAEVAVFHPGFYGDLIPETAFNAIEGACRDMLNRMRGKEIKRVRLGLETTGKVSQFGTLDEIIEICKKLKGCAPVVDFAHIYARQAGRIDYSEVFEKLKPLKLKHLHAHFTGMEWAPAKAPWQGNERRHLELKVDKPPFEPLAREVLKRKVNITLISESPILEKDSLEMKRTFERLGHRF